MMNILKLLAATAEEALESLGDSDSTKDVGSGFIVSLLNWAYAIAGLVAAGFIVYGAINYVLTQGDPGKIKQAGQTIAYAVVGLIVVLLAAGATNFIATSLGGM